jgi:hypothetical protein
MPYWSNQLSCVVELLLVLVGQVKWSTAKGQLISEDFFCLKTLQMNFFTDLSALASKSGRIKKVQLLYYVK